MTATDLEHMVHRFRDCRVAVVGDMMLDRYIWGHASRISQEAPVPVVRVDRETYAPGGAANVVRNITSLGAKALAFGVVGEDEHGSRLVEWLQRSGVDTRAVLATAARQTTVKTRVFAGSQQVVRVDREDTSAIDEALQQRLTSALAEKMRDGDIDAVILEDYAKGVLTAELVRGVVRVARDCGVLVALDPHPGHAFRVKGLRLMTPNRMEAFALAGLYHDVGRMPLEEDTRLLEVGRKLIESWEMELLLITLGSDGMALFSSDAAPEHVPTRAREVFDVSGAGDTVMATFVLSLLAGSAPIQAARIANHAAGLVVAEVGTAAVSAQELAGDLRADDA